MVTRRLAHGSGLSDSASPHHTARAAGVDRQERDQARPGAEPPPLKHTHTCLSLAGGACAGTPAGGHPFLLSLCDPLAFLIYPPPVSSPYLPPSPFLDHHSFVLGLGWPQLCPGGRSAWVLAFIPKPRIGSHSRPLS